VRPYPPLAPRESAGHPVRCGWPAAPTGCSRANSLGAADVISDLCDGTIELVGACQRPRRASRRTSPGSGPEPPRAAESVSSGRACIPRPRPGSFPPRGARHRAVSDDARWTLRQGALCGGHVHVRRPGPGDRLRGVQGHAQVGALADRAERELAFWHGRESGLASACTACCHRVPRTGTARRFRDRRPRGRLRRRPCSNAADAPRHPALDDAMTHRLSAPLLSRSEARRCANATRSGLRRRRPAFQSADPRQGSDRHDERSLRWPRRCLRCAFGSRLDARAELVKCQGSRGDLAWVRQRFLIRCDQGSRDAAAHARTTRPADAGPQPAQRPPPLRRATPGDRAPDAPGGHLVALPPVSLTWTVIGQIGCMQSARRDHGRRSPKPARPARWIRESP
jgi:hypothetical protein